MGLLPGPVKSGAVSPTTRHRCDVSSEQCCPGAEPRKPGTRCALRRSSANILNICFSN